MEFSAYVCAYSEWKNVVQNCKSFNASPINESVSDWKTLSLHPPSIENGNAEVNEPFSSPKLYYISPLRRPSPIKNTYSAH